VRRESRQITSQAEWLAWREKDVTASSIAVLWDQHPYMDREELAAKMRGERATLTTASMRAGTILEPAVAAAVQIEHPDWTITKAGTYHHMPDVKLGCTPDYFYSSPTVRRGILQCKTTSPQQWDKWRGTVPLAYVLQTLCEMLVTDAEIGLLAVLIRSPSYPLHEFTVERHPEAEQRILDAVGAWWDAWDRGEIAAPVDAAGIEAMLDTGECLDWSNNDEVRELLERRRELKATLSRITQDLGACDYQIKNRMGPASSAWLPGWSLTFARRERREYTVPAALVRTLRIKEIVYE
jgi:predicted phage-related endonuclease